MFALTPTRRGELAAMVRELRSITKVMDAI